MFNYKVTEELKSREAAKKYFPNYFRNLTGEFIIRYNKEDFQREYQKYLVKYFNDEIDVEERNNIKLGYDYLDDIYSKDINISNKRKTVGTIYRLWYEYTGLEKQIAAYRYTARWDDSKGAIQNSVNLQILEQLSLFNPIIYDICTTICKNTKEDKLSKKIKQELENKLDKLALDLNEARNKLYYYEGCYHEDWDHCARPVYYTKKATPKDLAQSMNEWRKSRNEACFTMLEFVRKLIEINIAVYYNTFDYQNEQYGLDEHLIQKINYYNECMKYIRHSKNYFCYLDEDEKQEIAIEKILKRK